MLETGYVNLNKHLKALNLKLISKRKTTACWKSEVSQCLIFGSHTSTLMPNLFLDNFKMYACVITVLLFCNITEQKHKWSETCCQHFYLESNRFFITFVNATSIIFNWPQLSARVAIPAEVKLPHCASTIDCSCLQCFPIAYSTRKKVLVD